MCPFCDHKFFPRNIKPIKLCPKCRELFVVELEEEGINGK